MGKIDRVLFGRRVAEGRAMRAEATGVEFTQADLGAEVGKNRTAVNAWERGYRLPQGPTRPLLAAALRVSLKWLQGATDDPHEGLPRPVWPPPPAVTVAATETAEQRAESIAVLSAASAELRNAWVLSESREIQRRELAFAAAATSVFGDDAFLKSALRDGLLRDLRPKPNADEDRKAEDGSV